MSGCVMGFVNCDGRDKPCPLHEAWCEVKAHLENTMSMVTVRDLQLLDMRNQSGAPRRCASRNAILVPSAGLATGSLGK